MMRRSVQLLASGAFVLLLSSPALASECQADIDAINQNATSAAPITAAEMQEVIRLRNLGQAECDANNIAQGLAYLAQAKSILGIQ